MADNDQSKIRYDDFISSVQPDPAKPESTIMLSGFVGHGPEGHARIYPDPTLGTWYDIPEGDILHSTPIADSKLGGSYIWVRASSEIKPGSAAPAATEAVQPQHAAAAVNPTPRTHCHVCDPPKAAAAVQPTPTPQTHCFICPPHTLAAHCWTAPVVCDHMQLPTPATQCIICPPHTQNCTPATICTLHGHCPPQHSVPPTLCTVPPTLPCSLLCQADPRAAAAPAALPHTAATVCTQFGCPPHTMVPTVWCTWVGCAPHGPAGGAPAGLEAAPQAAGHGVPGGLPQTHFLCTQGLATFCGCTPGIDCNVPAPQPHHSHFLCTQGLATFCTCTPGIDCMGLAARAAPQQANTGVTVCFTDCLPPGNEMRKAAVGVNPMDPTPATRCFFCDPPGMAAAAMQPTPTVQTHCFICPPHTMGVHCWTAPVVCGILPPSIGCQQGAQPQQAMAAPAHPNTAATVCTQFGCSFVGCTPHCPGGGFTPATVCTQPLGCTFVGCTPHCPGGGFTPATVCTQPLGCTFVGCTPHCPGGGPTPATVCTQPLGCTFVGCTPHCPGGGFTPATVCTQPNGVFTPFGR